MERKNRPIATYDIKSVPLKEKLEVYSEPEREKILEYDKLLSLMKNNKSMFMLKLIC